jgi:hypothetical protein
MIASLHGRGGGGAQVVSIVLFESETTITAKLSFSSLFNLFRRTTSTGKL